MTLLPPTHIALTIRHSQDKLPVREVILDEEGGTLGRAPANTITLAGDANVSLVHATLELIGARWVLKDIGDLVPVMRSGRPLGFGQRCDVGDGDEFSIANFILRVSLDPARIASITALSTPAPLATAAGEILTVPPLPAQPVGSTSATPTRPIPPAPQPSAALSERELQQLHLDPFAPSPRNTNARNFVGSEDHLLDGVLPEIQLSQSSALTNSLHRETNLDPLRHRSESIDALFSLEAGQGIDPLADVLSGADPADFVTTTRNEDPIMAVLNQQLGGTPNQAGSVRPGANDFESSINLPSAGKPGS